LSTLATAAAAIFLWTCADHARKDTGVFDAGRVGPRLDGSALVASCDATASANTDADALNSDAIIPCVAPCNGVCTDGRCLITLAETSSPVDIALDGASAYFTSCPPDGRSGAVLSVPLGGGLPTGVATGPGCPVSLALGDTSLYVAGLGGAGDVAKVSRSGGGLTKLASSADAPTGVTVDDANVYWATQGGALMKIAIGGGTPSLVARCQKTCTRPVVDANRVYWGDPYAGTIMSASRDGGSAVPVTGGLETVSSLAVGGNDLYFANGYFLAKAPLTGGAATGIGLPTGAPVGAVAVDDTSVYFTSWGSIWKVPFADVQPTRIAVTQGEPTAIAVDATSVYWTEGVASTPLPSGGCGRVMKLTPK
jgi:hypothetical protein